MKTIIVDDEPLMLQSFVRQSQGISAFNSITAFSSPTEALAYAEEHTVDAALLDIDMPELSGIELAKRLKELRSDILIVFITAHDEFLREANQLNADGYILKPYTASTLQQLAERLTLLSKGQQKQIYVQMFGTFTVFKNGTPVALCGKAKEILAYVASKYGEEVSNQEIYTTLWENRSYDNISMKVYYNAVKRLKLALESAGVSELLQSTPRGQIFNTEIVDCDFYAWKTGSPDAKAHHNGKFLSEYSWAEPMLSDILNDSGIYS